MGSGRGHGFCGQVPYLGVVKAQLPPVETVELATESFGHFLDSIVSRGSDVIEGGLFIGCPDRHGGPLVNRSTQGGC